MENLEKFLKIVKNNNNIVIGFFSLKVKKAIWKE